MKKYARLFKGKNGRVAKPLRLALGSLIIQTKYQYSDKELVDQLTENPYYQYFIGLPGYQEEPPIDASTLVLFRDMALIVSDLMGLKEEDKQKIHIAAHLHDIGKIGVPDAVLLKTTKLNDEEWAAIKKHPEIGAEILSKSHHLNELKDIVLHHHERYDGKGYPTGLVGADIPVGARIIAICDSIDAMSSNRCYRKAHDLDFCYHEIEKNLRIMYDTMIGQYVLDNWSKVVQ